MSELACVSGVDLLMDYLEGILPAATVAALDGHVAGCDRCQAFIASYLAAPRIVRDSTALPLPPTTSTALLVWLRQRRHDVE